jgi:2-methylcitrate dehydratase
MVRYLDFNDSYLAPGETCHPSDNLGAVLAGCEYARGSGKDLMVALAVAYQVQCRLSDVAPVRAKGFDHTTQGAYAASAGVAKALNLSQEQTANAIAICGTALNALRVTRTGALSNWKGLAYPATDFGATHFTFLAMRGITGPLEVFEGNKGFMDAIAGHFDIDWNKENLEKVTQTIVKKFNAEIHSQSALEGLLELIQEHPEIQADKISSIDLDIFDVAYNIIGGGEEGSKKLIRTKEEADHSLPYMLAVAVIDGQVMPDQYRQERIQQKDVQDLLQKINVRPDETFSQRFPAEMPCRLTVHLEDGPTFVKEKSDYEGFFTCPVSWATITRKFNQLSEPFVDEGKRKVIVDAVNNLENISVQELTRFIQL